MVMYGTNDAGLQTATQNIITKNQSTSIGTKSFVQLMTQVGLVILNPIITLLFAAALIYFMFGVFNYVRNAGSDSERAAGVQQMIWGVTGMFIMMAAFALVTIIKSTLGVS